MTGPVALLGSGEFLPVMERLDRRLLEGRPQRVVHLPTAAGQESGRRLRYWRDLARTHFERMGVEVETLGVLDANSANDPANVSRLSGAGLIYLSGGNPGYLAVALRGSAVLERISRLMDEGVAVAGCSAGAAALTEVAPDVRSGGSDAAGLRLIPGVAIVPHYDALTRRRRALGEMFTRSASPDTTVIGVDENTAIFTDDRTTFEVYGVGRAVRLSDGTVFGPGDRFEV
ncbi:MAG: Type 1 glutamine amidotransferase-like domain-containing protein [Acidimicrobiia bacterium]|nr:Type 1 glutamine amidotransferase-like domain-containing protein [Acidimicrobiia bacterium]